MGIKRSFLTEIPDAPYVPPRYEDPFASGGYFGQPIPPPIDRRDQPGTKGRFFPTSTVGANVIRGGTGVSQMPGAVSEPPISDLGTAPSIFMSPQRGHAVVDPWAASTAIYNRGITSPGIHDLRGEIVFDEPIVPLFETSGIWGQPTRPTDGEEPMDLGDIYDEIDRGFGGWLPGGVTPGQWPTGVFNPPTFLPPTQSPTLGVPVQTAPPSSGVCATGCDHPMKGYVWNPCANQGAGKWQKKSRRRSKTLLSPSQASQLSNLLSIAGNGKISGQWIATHG